MRVPRSRAADRSPASGTVGDLQTVAKAALGRIPKMKRPKPAEQGADKIADTARYEALAREHGADLSEEGFNEVLKKVARSA